MSEFIIDMGSSSYKSSSGLLCADVSQLREPVVRCRDCKRMQNWTADELADSYDKEELADGWCAFFRIGTYDDFFCAWGESAWVTCKCGQDIELYSEPRTCPSCGRLVYPDGY